MVFLFFFFLNKLKMFPFSVCYIPSVVKCNRLPAFFSVKTWHFTVSAVIKYLQLEYKLEKGVFL